MDGATLNGANLRGANLFASQLRGTDLSKANLSYANLALADLSKANLRRARLTKTLLVRTNLDDANFDVALFGMTTIADVDLSNAKGLESVNHDGPSSIGVDTLYRSQGKIPAEFLRGCGVPENFITYLPSLIGTRQPIQYQSCFISHSSHDDEFARRLHEKMRGEKLRVWFAPEDMQGGQKLIEQTDRAIQVNDCVLLVLSEHSMNSEWVQAEIRKARQAELCARRGSHGPTAD